jgi:hypothetical protein
MENSAREDILRNLIAFYDEKKISCDNFDCSNKLECSSLTKRPLNHGADAHLGTKYGEIVKVLVLSLDAKGDSQNIHNRTVTIESNIKANPHMKGTIEILKEFFSDYGFDRAEVLRHFAMTNATKCSASDPSSDKLPTEIYKKCRPYHRKEIEILNPDIIFIEGKDSTPLGFKIREENLQEIEFFSEKTSDNPNVARSIKNIIKRYVFKLYLQERWIYLVQCPHPSNRAGQWQPFRDISLPIITLYLKNKKGLTRNTSNQNSLDAD